MYVLFQPASLLFFSEFLWLFSIYLLTIFISSFISPWLYLHMFWHKYASVLISYFLIQIDVYITLNNTCAQLHFTPISANQLWTHHLNPSPCCFLNSYVTSNFLGYFQGFCYILNSCTLQLMCIITIHLANNLLAELLVFFFF